MLKQPLLNVTVECENLMRYVKRLQQINRSLDKAVIVIGESNDNREFRVSVNDELIGGTNLVKSLQSISNKLETHSTDNKISKMLSNMKPIIHKFDTLQSTVKSKINTYDINKNDNLSTNIDHNSVVYKQKQLQSLQFRQIAVDIDDLQHQHDALQQIADDMVFIKDAQQDLSNMVDMQQSNIDLLEKNVETGKENIERAESELIVAERKTNNTRRRKCLLTVICLFILAITIGIIVYQAKY